MKNNPFAANQQQPNNQVKLVKVKKNELESLSGKLKKLQQEV